MDAETGVIMLLYLDQAYEKWRSSGRMRNLQDLREAITEGAVKRIRPKMMTVMAILVGLLPIKWSHGAGGGRNETDRRADDRRSGELIPS